MSIDHSKLVKPTVDVLDVFDKMEIFVLKHFFLAVAPTLTDCLSITRPWDYLSDSALFFFLKISLSRSSAEVKGGGAPEEICAPLFN